MTEAAARGSESRRAVSAFRLTLRVLNVGAQSSSGRKAERRRTPRCCACTWRHCDRCERAVRGLGKLACTTGGMRNGPTLTTDEDAGELG